MKFPIYLALMKANGKHYVYANKPGGCFCFCIRKRGIEFL